MTTLSSHVLDLKSGNPAQGLGVSLRQDDHTLATAVTDADGRISTWLNVTALDVGVYELVFAVGEWWDQQGIDSFYPEVSVTFRIASERPHYHVPLLVSPFGYSTYRGS